MASAINSQVSKTSGSVAPKRIRTKNNKIKKIKRKSKQSSQSSILNGSHLALRRFDVGSQTLAQHTRAMIYPDKFEPHYLGTDSAGEIRKHSCVARITASAGADGTLVVSLFPRNWNSATLSNRATAFLTTDNGLVGAFTAATAVGMANLSILNSLATTIRPTAGLLKVTPLIAETAAPAYVVGGQVPYYTNSAATTLINATPTALALCSQLSSMTVGGGDVACVRWKSRHAAQKEFLPSSTSGSEADALVIVLRALPVSAVCLIEYAVHFEYMSEGLALSAGSVAGGNSHGVHNDISYAAPAVGHSPESAEDTTQDLVPTGVNPYILTGKEPNASGFLSSLVEGIVGVGEVIGAIALL